MGKTDIGLIVEILDRAVRTGLKLEDLRDIVVFCADDPDRFINCVFSNIDENRETTEHGDEELRYDEAISALIVKDDGYYEGFDPCFGAPDYLACRERVENN